MIVGLVTDRSQANVDRRNALSKKGWQNMTAAEQAEWSGSPLLATDGANLIPKGENYAAGVSVRFRGESITVTSLWDGTYIYGITVIGPAADYEGKTFTLSLDSFYSSGGGTPNVLLYWHDANGAEYAGGGLTEAGSMTFTLAENTGGRANLALYLYATTDTAITAGAYIRYERLMLEPGPVRHAYKPYYQVLPTPATKGAYNYSDLNRVESAVEELAASAGLQLVTKTNWTAWDLPKPAEMTRFLQNIAVLREHFPLSPEVPALPSSMEHLTYTSANHIEMILEKLAEAVDSAYRAGELYAGEV